MAPPAAPPQLHIILNGNRVLVPPEQATISLNQFIRGSGTKSSKLGCSEGGCGACAVGVEGWRGFDGKPAYRSVNSCLTPVFLVAGCSITTAEGLPKDEHGNSAVIERLAGFHASQCGFCTPGMAVACHTALKRAAAVGQAPSVAAMRDALDGNLCRCTGYRPIVDACKSFASDVDIEDLGANWWTARGQPVPGHALSSSGNKGCYSPPSPVSPLELPPGAQGAEAHAAVAAPMAVHVLGGGRTLYVPHSLAQLVTVCAEHAGRVRLVAGNTGSGVFKDLWPSEAVLVCTTLVAEFAKYEVQEVHHHAHDPFHAATPATPMLRLGAAATLAVAVEVLEGAGADVPPPGLGLPPLADGRAQGVGPDAVRMWREVAAHLRRIAGSHVRNSATLVGNLVLARTRGLPSDVATVLSAAGALVEVVDATAAAGPSATKHLTVREFVLASESPQLSAGLTAGTLVLSAVLLPVPKSGVRFWSSRLAQCYANAASLINAAMCVRLAPGGGVEHASVVFGMDLSPVPGKEDWKLVRCTQLQAAITQGTRNSTANKQLDDSSVTAGGLDVLAERLSGRLTRLLSTDHRGDSRSQGLGKHETISLADLLPAALAALHKDLGPVLGASNEAGAHEPQGHEDAASRAEFLRSAAEGLLLQGLSAVLGLAPAPDSNGTVNGHANGAANGSGGNGGIAVDKMPVPAVVKGRQDLLDPTPELRPMTEAQPKTGAALQAAGTAQYTDDVPVTQGALWGALVTATVAVGKVVSIDTTAALRVPGALRFIGAADVPGMNQLREEPPISAPEPLFATDVQYHGQPIGLMLGTSATAARAAARAVAVSYEQPAAPPIITIQQAKDANSYYMVAPLMPQLKPGTLPMSVQTGSGVEEMQAALAAAPHVIRGAKYSTPSQGHLYMEPHAAVAEPDEDGSVVVHSATQAYDFVMDSVSRVLGVPHNKVCVKVRRLGGAFGGKVTHANKVAAAAALGAWVAKAQVRVVLNRNTDMAIMGGRPKKEVEYDVAYDDEGKLLAVDLRVTLEGGAFLDIGWVDIYGMSSAADGVYRVPAFSAQYNVVRCNLPPRTTVRGPGDLEAVLIIENVIEHVAAALGLPPYVVRERNFRVPEPGKPLMLTSVGKPERSAQFTIPALWAQLKASSNFEARLAEVEAHNASHPWRKRGLSLVPAVYHLQLGAKSAIVHILADGGVLLVHPGVDMGQGLTTKVMQTAAYELGKLLPESQRPMPVSLFRAVDGSSHGLPHFSLTGGSTTTDMACEAVRLACAELVSRLTKHAEKLGADYTWTQLIKSVTGWMGVKEPLTAHAHGGVVGSIPLVEGVPNPGAYAVYGVAAAEVEVDALTGDRRVRATDIVFDVGRSINPAIDLGQIEGAFMFGLGAVLHEHVEHDPVTGACLTNSTWSYKVPGVGCVPEHLSVSMLKDSPLLVQGAVSAKACQEPPLLLASSVLFALQAATRAAASQTFNDSSDALPYEPLIAPATVQAVKAACGTQPLSHVLLRLQ